MPQVAGPPSSPHLPRRNTLNEGDLLEIREVRRIRHPRAREQPDTTRAVKAPTCCCGISARAFVVLFVSISLITELFNLVYTIYVLNLYSNIGLMSDLPSIYTPIMMVALIMTILSIISHSLMITSIMMNWIIITQISLFAISVLWLINSGLNFFWGAIWPDKSGATLGGIIAAGFFGMQFLVATIACALRYCKFLVKKSSPSRLSSRTRS